MKNFTVSEPQLKIDNLKKNFETDIEPIDYSKSFSDDSQTHRNTNRTLKNRIKFLEDPFDNEFV